MPTSDYSKDRIHIMSFDTIVQSSRKMSMKAGNSLLRKPDKRCIKPVQTCVREEAQIHTAKSSVGMHVNVVCGLSFS